MKTVKLLFWSAVAYAVLLLLVSGLFTPETRSAIPLTAIPLIVITVIIVRDLARRSTEPAVKRTFDAGSSLNANLAQFLSGQIKVAANASDSYFDDVVRARLKELLIMKITVETGLETETVRKSLSSPRTGPDLLNDELLYTMLYGPVPANENRRMELIEGALDLIGAWKG